MTLSNLLNHISISFQHTVTTTNTIAETVVTNPVVQQAVQQTTENPSYMSALLAGILAFFAFGGLGFWLLLAFLSIVYTIAVENDKHGFAIFATVVAVLLGWTNISWLFQNWHLLLIGIASYGIIGGAWMIWRFRRFCKHYVEHKHWHPSDREVWDENQNDRAGGRNRRPMTDTEWKVYQNEQLKEELSPSKHKSRCISWIVYWPWSLLWNFLGDFFTGIYESLSNVLINVRDSVIKSALKQP